MGEIAEGIVNGDYCQECGSYIGEGEGYPRTCDSCRPDEKVYAFSNKKIKRYMEIDGKTGQHIKWISNADWEKIKDTDVKIISESERQELRSNT